MDRETKRLEAALRLMPVHFNEQTVNERDIQLAVKAADALLAELERTAKEPKRGEPVAYGDDPEQTVYGRRHEYIPAEELADLRRKAKALDVLEGQTTLHRTLDCWGLHVNFRGVVSAPTLLALAEKISGGEK